MVGLSSVLSQTHRAHWIEGNIKQQGFRDLFIFSALLTLILNKFHGPQGPASLDRGQPVTANLACVTIDSVFQAQLKRQLSK